MKIKAKQKQKSENILPCLDNVKFLQKGIVNTCLEQEN